MPKQLLFTRLLNHHFAGSVDALLRAFHIQPAHPHAPITNAFAMELLVFLVLIAYFIAVRLTLSVEKPAAVQHLAEAINSFMVDQTEPIIGHEYTRFLSFISVLGMFILLSNLMGLVPGLESPTA